jgi:hypothetical protein
MRRRRNVLHGIRAAVRRRAGMQRS